MEWTIDFYRFWWQKSRFGFQFRSFWLPKCRPCIGLTEKSATTKSCASPRLSTLDSSHRCLMRTTSGACDGEDCWSRRPCTCSDAITTPTPTTPWTPAIRGAGDLRQTTPLPYQRATATYVSDRRTLANTHELFVYGILVNCQPISAHAVKHDSIRWPWLQ